MQAWTNGVSERVLDSSALLAVIKEEPGRERVESALEAGVAMSVVNLGEVVSRLADQGKSLAEIESELGRFDITYHLFDERAAHMVGLLRPLTRDAGLSFGDRACVALAIDLRVPVLTGDRPWTRLELGNLLSIELFC